MKSKSELSSLLPRSGGKSSMPVCRWRESG